MMLEPLEPRRLLSFAISDITAMSVTNGQLTVTCGDYAADFAVLARPQGDGLYGVTIRDNNLQQQHSFADIHAIQVHANGGNDRVAVWCYDDLNLAVNLGSGNDVFDGTRLSPGVGVGALYVIDPSGNDSFTLSGSAWDVQDAGGNDTYRVGVQATDADVYISDSHGNDHLYVGGGATDHGAILTAPSITTIWFDEGYHAAVNGGGGTQFYDLET